MFTTLAKRFATSLHTIRTADRRLFGLAHPSTKSTEIFCRDPFNGIHVQKNSRKRVAMQKQWISTTSGAKEITEKLNEPNYVKAFKELLLKQSKLFLDWTIEDAIKHCESCFDGWTWKKKSPEDIATYQQQRLGILYKRNLPTNLFKNESMFDYHWLGTTVSDEITNYLIRQAKVPSREQQLKLFVLRAPSGAGKTGAIFELSNHAFVFYVACGQTVKDNVNKPFQDLSNQIDKVTKDNGIENTSRIIIQNCAVFCLAHALALEMLHSKVPNLSTRDWLHWSTSVGQEVIAAIQNKLNNYFAKQEFLSPTEIQSKLLDPLLEKYNVWLAVDEAQTILNETQGKSVASKHENLLRALLDSCNAGTRRIVAGTGLKQLEQSGKTAVAKTGSVFYQTGQSMNFPLLTQKEVQEFLNKYLAIEELKVQATKMERQQLEALLDDIAKNFQGRPGFIVLLLNTLANWNTMDLPEAMKDQNLQAPKTVDEAIKMLTWSSEAALAKMQTDCHNLLDKAMAKQPETKKKLLFHHVTEISLSAIHNTNHMYDPEQLEREFNISPEDLGVVAFKPVYRLEELPVLHYAVLEPKPLNFLLKWLFPQDGLGLAIHGVLQKWINEAIERSKHRKK